MISSNLSSLISSIIFILGCLTTTFIALKILNKSKSTFIIYIGVCFISIIYNTLSLSSNSIELFIFYLIIVCGLYCVLLKIKLGTSIATLLISLSITYIVYFIALFLSFLVNNLLPISNDFLNFLVIAFFYFLVISVLIKHHKFKNGFNFLARNPDEEYLSIRILNVSAIIVFCFVILINSSSHITSELIFPFTLLAIILGVIIFKSLKQYYKHTKSLKERALEKQELLKLRDRNSVLEIENLEYAKKIHSYEHKRKILEYNLNKFRFNSEISSEISIVNNINFIPKVNIVEIDDLFSYFNSECDLNNIDFTLQVSSDINLIYENYISKECLETLLADHLKNALIAVKHSNNTNKSVLVKLGVFDYVFRLEIYDSGTEFSSEMLKELGNIPQTTHSSSGGSGFGFMNTFDTLKKYNISFTIREISSPSANNYTKALIFKFNNTFNFSIENYK